MTRLDCDAAAIFNSWSAGVAADNVASTNKGDAAAIFERLLVIECEVIEVESDVLGVGWEYSGGAGVCDDVDSAAIFDCAVSAGERIEGFTIDLEVIFVLNEPAVFLGIDRFSMAMGAVWDSFED